jgi:large subunit ribosomal protein L35
LIFRQTGSPAPEAAMPKQKTNKSIKKRFRVTGTGKLTRNQCNKRHLLSGRSAKRKRQLRKPELVPAGVTAKYLRAIGEG